MAKKLSDEIEKDNKKKKNKKQARNKHAKTNKKDSKAKRMEKKEDNKKTKQEKKATVYENFTYDTESNGGCLDKFINLSKIIETVANDVHDLGTKYGTLQSKYGQFTDFNEKMNTNTNSLTSSIDAIRTAFDQIIKNLDSQVAYFSKQDASFMGDLDSINKMLTTGGQAATGGGGTSGGGGSAGGGGTSGGGGAPSGSGGRAHRQRQRVSQRYCHRRVDHRLL